jgi:flagellar protein FliL
MAEATTAAEAAPRKRKPLAMILGAVAALALGGAGFYATYSGMLMGEPEEISPEEAKLAGIAFVPLEPLVISLGENGLNQFLRFAAHLEVAKAYAEEVEMLQPRILDVLNGYLRAVDMKDLQDPTALIRLRAQMLRRLQIVTGEGRVRDLLITEFVLN